MITITITKRQLIIIAAVVALLFTIVGYDLTPRTHQSETQESNYNIKEMFTFDMSEVFTGAGDFAPGEYMSVNPVITSGATEDMYAFFRLEMPLAPAGDSGLYNLNVNGSWSRIEGSVVGDQWVEVYRYGEVLTPGQSTAPLADRLNMVNMNIADYVQIYDFNIKATGYACSSDEMSEEDAWSAISQKYGV